MILSAGILSPIETPLEDLLVWLHSSVGFTWAWSIIALTALVRLVIFPITAKQTKSSLAMQRLQPHMKTLQSRYKDDRTQLNQAMMEFYRDNKVNPLASCFPLLIQIPIFLALFFVLKDFKAPSGTSDDFSWMFGFVDDIRRNINNTLAGDLKGLGIPRNWAPSGWILLVVYIASQMLSTVTMMNSPNPQQKYIFLAMPLLFSFFILNFPVGVMLYWITTNLWSLGQYLLVVALTDKNKEIILPADTKGRKKVIAPKGANKSGSGTQGSKPAAAPHSAPARRNKRRK
ncbi:MAG: YidC/Oxa1 family rane protein insertase [Thermoleophilia bacterium]|nr:YidC/Oxa1 family rane protein insertase [Thermoleophilia bacterium]MCZ4496212.1 YidC/Oxa1 family rane protein insertase [Thermoleophilia bacterium]